MNEFIVIGCLHMPSTRDKIVTKLSALILYCGGNNTALAGQVSSFSREISFMFLLVQKGDGSPNISS